MKNNELILILDFGGQYNQLIARRVRECNVYSEVVPFDISIEKIKEKNPKGIIFTGGPASVYGENAPRCAEGIFELGIPVLGICYGMQLMTYTLGGNVARADKREYGTTDVSIDNSSLLFEGFENTNGFLMSHTDFVDEAKKIGEVDYLVQGTIYPDVIESGLGKSSVIKSHHNVGGLPDYVDFKEIIEPLRDLFKDEVRKTGLELGMPENLVFRQPFPGPGLAIRIIGDITEDKLNILKEADSIFREEIANAGLHKNINQYFAVLTNLKSVGVMGDERTYDYTVALRAVETTDFMTGVWSKIPYEVLEKVSSRIVNEVNHVNRVVYDITSKPPATIEWE